MPLKSGVSPEEPLAILYDDHCRLCRGSRRTLEALAMGRNLYRFVSIHEPDSTVMARLNPPIQPERLSARMHVLMPDGKVTAGADAVAVLLGVLPFPIRIASLLWKVPGFADLARVFYDVVARNRHRVFPCADHHTGGHSVCGLSNAEPPCPHGESHHARQPVESYPRDRLT